MHRKYGMKFMFNMYLLFEANKDIKDRGLDRYIKTFPKDFSIFPIFFGEDEYQELKGTSFTDYT